MCRADLFMPLHKCRTTECKKLERLFQVQLSQEALDRINAVRDREVARWLQEEGPDKYLEAVGAELGVLPASQQEAEVEEVPSSQISQIRVGNFLLMDGSHLCQGVYSYPRYSPHFGHYVSHYVSSVDQGLAGYSAPAVPSVFCHDSSQDSQDPCEPSPAHTIPNAFPPFLSWNPFLSCFPSASFIFRGSFHPTRHARHEVRTDRRRH